MMRTIGAMAGASLFLLLPVSCGEQEQHPGQEPPMHEAPEEPEEESIHDEWDQAAEAIRRLSLDAFPTMPDRVRGVLAELECVVPQVWFDDRPHNVIRGSFAAPGQEDWAALCSRNGANVIVVVWGGPEACEPVLAEGRDRNVLQGVGEGQIGFSRAIETVDPDGILRYQREYGGPEPPSPLTHQGINDLFVEKASVVRYCHDGKWLRLTGID